ncbi:MAG: hypothetical protein ABW223_02105, partial [Rariglobus sp.]
PEAVRIGVLQSKPERAEELKTGGVSIAVLGVSWDRFEPAADKPDAAYLEQLRAELAEYKKAGLEVVLDLGIQYPPAWLFDIPDSRYQNQYGTAFVDRRPGMNVANSVFNAAVRDRQAAYMASLFRELGTTWYAVRLGGGWYSELNYPPASFQDNTNCYWGFDPLAQGARPDRPAGVTACPVPGWKPGTASEDNASARRFAQWYMDSLKNYHDWQITTARSHYAGPLMMLYPSWGIRPGQLDAAIAGDLAGLTSPEKNGEIQRGFDFTRFIAGIRDSKVWIHCTWLDSNPEWSDDTGSDEARWSPARFLSSLARKQKPALTVSAENTGGGGLAALELCARRIRELNIKTFLWAFGPDLFDNQPPELSDLSPALAR